MKRKKRHFILLFLLITGLISANAEAPTSGSAISLETTPRDVIFTGDNAGNLVQQFNNDENGTSWGTVTTLYSDYAYARTTGCGYGTPQVAMNLATSRDVSAYNMIAVDVYSETAQNIGIKFVINGSETSAIQTAVPANQWFRIIRSVPENTTQLSRIDLVQGSCDSENLLDMWFDNVHFYYEGPDVKADNPPVRIAANYLSLYNESPYNTPNPVMGGHNATNENFLVDGEYCGKITLTPVSWGAAAYFRFSSPSDVNPYEYLYFDIWSDEAIPANTIRASLIGGSDIEADAPIPAFAAKQWTPCRIKLSDLSSSNLSSILSSVKEVRISSYGLNFTSKTVYVDNVYFFFPEDPEYAPVTPVEAPPALANLVSLYPAGISANWSGTTGIGNAEDPVTGADNEYRTINNLATANAALTVANAQGIDVSNQSVLQMHVWVKPAQLPLPTLTLTLGDVSGATFAYPVSGLIAGQWNIVEVPVYKIAGINTAQFKSVGFSGTETVYIDNVCFYTTNGNVEDVAEVNGVKYRSIKEAYEANKNNAGTVEIAVTANSNETERIFINYDTSTFTKLIIYPKDVARTVSYTGNYTAENMLIYVEGTPSDDRSVEIDGRINKEGTARGFTFRQANQIPLESRVNADNAIIWVAGNNVLIQYCNFQGLDENKRAERTIIFAGANVKILHNHFIDCLFLGDTYDGTEHYAAGVINAFYYDPPRTTKYDGVEISYNDFYETSPAVFTAPLMRYFINYAPVAQTGYTTPVQIVGNRIGGTGRVDNKISGTMQFGSTNAGVESSILYGIIIQQDYPNASISPGDLSKYAVVDNNEIAQISLIQPTHEFYNLSGSDDKVTELGTLTGISTMDGLVWVKNNMIHTLSNKVSSATEVVSDKYLLMGIRNEINGGSSRFITEKNDVHGFTAGYLNASPNAGYVYGIFGQVYNNYSNSSAYGTIKGNRVVLGNDFSTFAMGEGTAFGAISARVMDMVATSSAQIDVCDNIAVLSKFIFNASVNSPHNVDAISLHNALGTDGTGIINCFNNIAYVQPDGLNSFSSTRSSINGIRANLGSTDHKTLIFHNTVLIKNLNIAAGDNTISRAFMISLDGRADFYNNNFVNLSPKGNLFYSDDADNFLGDYNNYYYAGEESAIFTLSNKWSCYSFDEWKLRSFEVGNERDLHGRFIDPLFGNHTASEIASISVTLTPQGIDDLKTILQPYRFLGGRKSQTAAGSELGRLIIARDDASNTDIVGNVRRPYMPTMGAINTGFANYWVGGVDSSWNDDGNWNEGVPQEEDIDIVFAPDVDDIYGKTNIEEGETVAVANNLVLPDNMKVHDIYNDTRYQVELNGQELTITGYVASESFGDLSYTKINAEAVDSKVIYNGNTTSNPGGSTAQHIFERTFTNNKVASLDIKNESNYFVLLHDDLEITDRFINSNQNRNSTENTHLGGLNCILYPVTLTFSGPATANTADDYQRIPANVFYNDSLYNLVVNSTKLVTEHDLLYIKNDLTIGEGDVFGQSAKKLEIAAGKFVKTIGLTTNNGGINGLTLKARQSESETTANASFIFNNGKTNEYGNAIPNTEVNATVEMFSPAKSVGGNYRWQFFTVPVEYTVPIRYLGAFAGAWIRRRDPVPTNGDPYWGTPYWLYVENDDTMTHKEGYTFVNTKGGRPTSYNMQGYEMTMSAPRLIPFQGKLNNEDLSTDLVWSVYNEDNLVGKGDYDWSKEQSEENGEYIFGNPYTAALDISQMEFGTNLDPTVYIYTTGSYSDWSGTGAETAPGQYQAVPKNIADTEPFADKRYLSSMQGFMVVMNSSSSANNTFGVKYNATAETVSHNRATQRSVRKQEEMPYTIIDLTSENYADRFWLFVNEACSKGYDAGWDGRKYYIGTGAGQVFGMEGKEKYQVSTVNDIDETYLGVTTTDKDSEYTLTFNHKGMEDKYTKITLIDLVEDVTVDITESGSSYTFTSPGSRDDVVKRFKISTFDDVDTGVPGPETDEKLFHIYAENNIIFIENVNVTSGTYFLYDMTGKCLLTGVAESGQITSVHTSLPTGSYILKLTSGEKNINKLLILN